MNFSLRGASSSSRAGRAARSCLSTSIRRRPRSAYSCSRALMSEDLPVPRAPVSRALLAGRSARNCSVLRTRRWVCGLMAHRRARGKVCGRGRAVSRPPLPCFCQRKAMACQSGSRGSGGRSWSRRRSTEAACVRKGLSFMIGLGGWLSKGGRLPENVGMAQGAGQ